VDNNHLKHEKAPLQSLAEQQIKVLFRLQLWMNERRQEEYSGSRQPDLGSIDVDIKAKPRIESIFKIAPKEARVT
jgi:hypothetical protein